MKFTIFILLGVIISVLSCTKTGTTSDASAPANNGVGTGGSLARFVIVEDYLYIADESDVKVFDISNNGLPVEKDPVYTGGGIETIFSYDNNLFLGSTNGMFIYSLENPAKPTLTGLAQHLRSCDPVVANDSFAFVTLRGGTPCGSATDGLYVYNIQDITNPVQVSLLEMSTPSGLALNGNIVYVCRQTNGMSVINANKTAEPVMVKTIEEADFRDAIVYNQLLICYVSTGIRLYDISVADNPVFISSVANE